ncbi:hypothetical protein C5167_002094, partial [Papaver somniferum]
MMNDIRANYKYKHNGGLTQGLKEIMGETLMYLFHLDHEDAKHQVDTN